MKKCIPSFLLVLIVLTFSSCQTIPSEIVVSPTISVTKNAPVTPTPIFSTAPIDPELDQTCRVTITYFFSVDKTFDIEAVRTLFVPTRLYFADAILQRQTPLLILQIVPASEMWQKKHLNEPIPKFMLPEKKNQFIYFAEYTGTYAPNSTEIAPYPTSMLVIVESQGPYDCKIENYGWG